MKNIIQVLRAMILFFSILSISFQIKAQNQSAEILSKDELKLQKLEEKV